ncbi:flagellar protein FlgN [Fuchsiella alkaliacetigena]|uniref:flagellar protein FlgN n=1 Tax=Fuchsiella alkaliacetigena TaxID=957042 RepID=UPI00200A5024|nr:flagellar protein FlgN [Fuchsiella alkaliacetigena]MCK8824171.1 flagellar protein FlgN [Fuchsiella alkaliacetigena]
MLINNLIKILEVQYRLYQQLYRLSEEKQQIIIDNEVEELLEIIETEQEHLQKVEQLEAKRVETLEELAQQHSLAVSELDFARLIELLDCAETKAQLQELREKLLIQLRELQQLNDQNAGLIKQVLQLNDHTLQLLTNSELTKGSTYQKPGQEKTGNKQARNIIDHKA